MILISSPMHDLASFFFDAYRNASWVSIAAEAVVFLLGIVSVWLAKREHIMAFPTGLVATVLTAYLLFRAGYIGDMLINVYFSGMGIYGWYKWASGGQTGDTLHVSRTNSREKLTGLALFILTIVVIFAVYNLYGIKIRPENGLDIFISGLFFTAMWYMALKKIENWTLYIAADTLAIPIYAYRGLGMLALQYVIFTVLAILAYREWRKLLKPSPGGQT
jgi:nicotinamide mononucleotide transporter